MTAPNHTNRSIDEPLLIFDSPLSMSKWSRQCARQSRSIALVPTMGALHDGHLALVAEARVRADLVVVSIFVNPLQFNSRADFELYPRPVDSDLQRCRDAGVDAVYAPTAAAMYPPAFDTRVEPGALALPLEGAHRPGHFVGVATVVAKLLLAVRPDVAVFGRKDYQQLAVISRMAVDLDMDVEIIGLATVREPDGLALSSRNRRLTVAQRSAALVVPRALDAIEAGCRQGIRATAALQELAIRTVAAEPLATLEHVEIVDPETLAALDFLVESSLVVIAIWIGDVRLIDNRLLA